MASPSETCNPPNCSAPAVVAQQQLSSATRSLVPRRHPPLTAMTSHLLGRAGALAVWSCESQRERESARETERGPQGASEGLHTLHETQQRRETRLHRGRCPDGSRLFSAAADLHPAIGRVPPRRAHDWRAAEPAPHSVVI